MKSAFLSYKVVDGCGIMMEKSKMKLLINLWNELEKGLKSIRHKNYQVKGLEASDKAWHDREDYPEENRWIIVKDKDDKEYKYHQWNGNFYYMYTFDADGCDGWRSDIDIVAWRYDYKKGEHKI